MLSSLGMRLLFLLCDVDLHILYSSYSYSEVIQFTIYDKVLHQSDERDILKMLLFEGLSEAGLVWSSSVTEEYFVRVGSR